MIERIKRKIQQYTTRTHTHNNIYMEQFSENLSQATCSAIEAFASVHQLMRLIFHSSRFFFIPFTRLSLSPLALFRISEYLSVCSELFNAQMHMLFNARFWNFQMEIGRYVRKLDALYVRCYIDVCRHRKDRWESGCCSMRIVSDSRTSIPSSLYSDTLEIEFGNKFILALDTIYMRLCSVCA